MWIRPAALAGEAALGFERTFLLLAQLIELAAARALQAAAVDELDDRVQLAGIQERAVALADVDHDAGDAGEVDAVHHLSAADAGAILDGS